MVVTPAHKADLQCVSTILPTRYRYLGMIGSRKKVAATFRNLEDAGFTREQIDTIFAPIGLPIGAVTPAEIAFSILGQIIQEKNKHHAASVDRSLSRKHHACARRCSVARRLKPQSISSRVSPYSTSVALPRLPLPREQ